MGEGEGRVLVAVSFGNRHLEWVRRVQGKLVMRERMVGVGGEGD